MQSQKALIDNHDVKYIAKFAFSSDIYSVVKAEFIAMRLAALAGLDAVPVQLVEAAGKDVLLIKRFDRIKSENNWTRKSMISGNRNLSQPKLCLEVAHHFLLSQKDALEICEHIESVIREFWAEVCEKAQLKDIDKKLLWKRQFLNPFAFDK